MQKFVLTAIFLALLIALLYSPNPIPEVKPPMQIIDNKTVNPQAFVSVKD